MDIYIDSMVIKYENIRVHSYLKQSLIDDIIPLIRKQLKIPEYLPLSQSTALRIVFEHTTGKKFENDKLI